MQSSGSSQFDRNLNVLWSVQTYATFRARVLAQAVTIKIGNDATAHREVINNLNLKFETDYWGPICLHKIHKNTLLNELHQCIVEQVRDEWNTS